LNGLKKRYEQFRRAGAEIVTISADSVEELENYRNRSSAPFLMLSDPHRTTIKQYGVFNPSEREGIAIPATFIVDQAGIITYSKVESTLLRTRSKRLLKEIAKTQG
jgi:peroxiredoxin Q/BCP